ncbi:MAG: hypothetical protein ACI4OI_06805, partial [Gemmiger sp.]
MQKIVGLLRRHRLAVLGLLVTLAALLAVAWVWHDVPPRVDGRSVYQILNDEYDHTRSLPAQGLSQRLPVPGGQTLYGMRLNVTTYDHAFHGGALRVTLCSDAGEPLAQAVVSCVGMADNTFADFVFARPYTPAADESLWLHIAQEPSDAPEDAQQPVGFWCSTSIVNGWPLVSGSPASLGEDCGGTLAMQYIINYTGLWSGVFALVIGVPAAVAVILGFLLLFVYRARLAAITAAGILLLGGAFSVLTPPLVAPDEYTHLAVSYMYASELMGQTS